MQRLNSVNPRTRRRSHQRVARQRWNKPLDRSTNAARVMANSPAVLESFLSFATAIGWSEHR